MFNEAINQDPTVYAIPVFIVLIALELFIDIRQKLKLYESKDTAACISMGLGVIVIGLLTKTMYFFLYSWIFQFRIFDLENTWWMWVLLLFADDFSFYWHHRLSHEVRILWAAHVQHHSSERLNLAVALRQSWGEPFYKYLFYCWIPLLGFDPIYIFVMQAISLIYQFFQHTELVGTLGPIEWIFNTPSHHRVHHAVQHQYLDRNVKVFNFQSKRLLKSISPLKNYIDDEKPDAIFAALWPLTSIVGIAHKLSGSNSILIFLGNCI